MTDINSAIEMALQAVEPQLASILDTSFERATVTDTFWVNEPVFRQGSHVQTEFRLSRGLLVAVPQATTSTRISLFDTVPPSDLSDVIQCDLGKGIVRDWSSRYEQQYVRFEYEAGFEADEANPASYNLSQVPKWLQEAAKLRCLMHLAKSPTLTEAGIDLDRRTLEAQYAALINTHIRYAPLALLPL